MPTNLPNRIAAYGSEPLLDLLDFLYFAYLLNLQYLPNFPYLSRLIYTCLDFSRLSRLPCLDFPCPKSQVSRLLDFLY
jgi:hypothetical protein